ncbi:hypothetical protein JL722_10667 [Aureococcus anophagefferens]|nr:hypothetical protein JL722_10667 [Aureococcus anophagefferens]
MPDVDDAAPPRRKVRRREKERRPQRSLSAEPVKSLSDGEAAPAQTPFPRTPAAATPGRGAALFRKILTPKSAASNWRTLRQALATIGGDRAWYSLTRHQGGPSAEDATAALLELSGIVHTGVALPSVDGAAAAGGAAPGPARIALLEQHDDRSLKIFRERVAIAIRGRATALVITEKMARLVDERRRESPHDALVDLNELPFPVVVLPESDNEFLRDEMPQWSNTRLDGWRDLEKRCAAAGGAEPKESSLVAREALAAAHRGHDFILDSFDDRGVDVLGARDDRGRTALMLAATYGRLGVVKKLRQLAQRAEDRGAGRRDRANERDMRGRTAVMHCVIRNRVDVLAALLGPAWRADPRSPDAAGLNPLKAAVKNGRNEAATVLLRHGAWVREDTAEPWAQDVYRFAVEKGLCDVVRELYEARAKLLSYSRYDGKGDVLDMDLGSAVGSPLLHAIRRRRHDVVDQLLRPYRDARGATFHLCNVDAKDGAGRRALHEAAILGDVGLVSRLMTHVQGWPTIWYGGEKRVSLNAQDDRGYSALMHAASLGYVKVVLALCDPLNRSGAEVSAKDKYGHTPLHLASDRKNVSIIRALLDHNADVDARDINGNTPLHSAARVGATGAVMVLLQSGSHVDTANKWGDTALHISLMRYHTKDQKLKLSTLGWLDEDQAYGETSLREKLSGFGHGTMRRLGDLAHGDLPAAFGGGRERRLSSVVEVADVAKKGNFEGVEHYFNIKKDDLEGVLHARHAAVFRSPASIGRAILRFLCAPFAGAPTNQHKTRVADAETPKEGETPPHALKRRDTFDDADSRSDHHGEAPYHLLFGNKRVQKAVGTVWLRKCFAGSVLMLAFYLVFVACLTTLATVVVTGSSGSSFASSAEFARGLRDAFAEDGFAARTAARKPAKGPHPFDGEALGFDQVTNADDLFHFLETTFAAALDAPAPERWSGDGQESIEVDGRDFLPGFGVLVGLPRLMQWRSRANLCDVPDRAEGMVAFCFREPRALTYATYPAGGFAVDLPRAAANRSDVLASLAANDWVDAATRAVDLRLVVYNANANLFCALHFVVEFPPEGGGGIPYVESRVARVWPYLATGAGGGGGGGGDGAGDGGVVLWLEVACFVFACFFFVQEFDQAVHDVDGDDVDWNARDEVVPVDRAFALADRHIMILSFLCWVSWLRILEYLRVWKRAAILVLEITYMVQHLTVFGVLMLIVCMAFASAEHIMFAWSDPHYNTMVSALGMNWGSAFGEVSYWEILTMDGAGTGAFQLLSVLYLLIVVLLLMNLLIALLSEQTVKAHERSAKYWCFVQLGMVTHQRDSFVSLLGNGIARTFRRAAFADAGAARDFGAYGVMMEKLEARVDNAMDVDRDAAGLAPAQRSPRVAVAATPAPPVTPLDEGAAAILKGAKDANGGGTACLMLCKRLLDRNEPWPDYATFLRTHVGALYPEIESEQHDAASRERSERIESLCLVAKLFGKHRGGWNECKTGNAPLSDADLTFLREELLERVVASPQNDARTRAEKLDNLFCYLACCTVGKIKAFADDVALETQLESVDHDLILRNAMSACPGLLPSYQRLDQGPDTVYLVASTAFNLGQFLQGESLPASLAPLKHLCKSDPSLLRFTLFSWIARARQRSAAAAAGAGHAGARDARALLVDELNKSGVDDGWAILVYYAPDLLRNILTLDKQNPDSDGTNGVMHGLVLLAKAATKGMTLNRFLDESAFVLEHMGDEGLVNTKECKDHFAKSHPPSDHGRSPGRIRR